MIDRYLKRRVILNDSPIYSDYFEERSKKYVTQYNSAKFTYPTEEQLKTIEYIEHTWSTGDRLYKLANEYLGDKHNWWIILKFNKIGSEVLIKKGDIIKIPIRIEEILGMML